ncbi:MAG: cell division protein FtsQ/DivIB [Candidatus Omnitrophota bacterium]|nr:cell division protein FtsQ/DivIB [Candidatus Omnitrophota bacterium]
MAHLRAKLKKSLKKKRNGMTIKPFPYKKLLFCFAVFMITAGIFASFYILYAKSKYFIVKNVILTGRKADSSVNCNELERMLVERNIFSLRLKEIRNHMLANYPELLSLRLNRIFPDSVHAVMVLREPVAQVNQQLYYPVDGQGVMLSDVKEHPDENLPIINGVRVNLSGEIGKMAESKRLKKALALLKEIKNSGIPGEHTIVEIDAANIRNMSFFLEDGLEVKIGREEYVSRLKKLKEELSDPQIKPADIRYIDLRFGQPVIGPRWKR